MRRNPPTPHTHTAWEAATTWHGRGRQTSPSNSGQRWRPGTSIKNIQKTGGWEDPRERLLSKWCPSCCLISRCHQRKAWGTSSCFVLYPFLPNFPHSTLREEGWGRRASFKSECLSKPSLMLPGLTVPSIFPILTQGCSAMRR